MIRLLFSLGLVSALGASDAPAVKTHQDWRREALQAYTRHDYPAFQSATEAALALRPDSPRYLFNLALAHTLNGHPDDALATLRRLTALGVAMPIAQAPDFTSLRNTPGFEDVLRAMSANLQPHGQASVAFELPGMTGIVEGIAYRAATKEFFFGDVHNRCVWRRTPDGSVSQFSATDAGLLGAFNLTVDEPHHLLWVSTSMLPEVSGYSVELKGRAALCALDLNTGRVVQTCALPADGRDHCLGDLLLAPDGTLYATDSFAPVIWRLTPGADKLEPLVESPIFSSLQGLGLVAGGAKLLLTDYANGLVTIDLATRAITALAPPANATLLGLDGLVVRGGDIIAVQNGLVPQRVLRISLTPDASAITGVEVLEAAIPGFSDLTLITLVNGQPHVVSQSGWSGFDDPKAAPPSHTVSVMVVSAP